MTWREFLSFYQDKAYHMSLDTQTVMDLLKRKSPLYVLIPSKVKATFYAYIMIIYLLRTMSIIALPMSYYYEIGDWWYGLFGWIISDYLYYELRNIMRDDLLQLCITDENFYEKARSYETQGEKELFLIQKKSLMKPLPIHKKIVEIFFK